MYVCLCLLAYLKNHMSKFRQMLPVAVARSADGNDVHTLCTSGFMDNVIFHIMERMGQNQNVPRMFRVR